MRLFWLPLREITATKPPLNNCVFFVIIIKPERLGKHAHGVKLI